MPLESIRVSGTIPASPERVYRAWLNSSEHSAIIGSKAWVKPVVGSRFTAWDGYISGVTLELEPARRIVQKWRTTEFPPHHPDSLLTVILAPAAGGTLLTLVHEEIPAGQGDQYEQGWRDYYLTPMKAYFGARAQDAQPAAADKAPAQPAAVAPVPAVAEKPADPEETVELVPPLPPLPTPKKPARKPAAAKKKAPARKPAAATKKSAARKPAAAKKKAPARKPAVKKKSAARKPAAVKKKSAARKPAAPKKKSAARKPAAKKAAPRKKPAARRR